MLTLCIDSRVRDIMSCRIFASEGADCINWLIKFLHISEDTKNTSIEIVRDILYVYE